MFDECIAYFDVDTREPSSSGDGLRLRSRADPIRIRLEQVFRFAAAKNQRIVSTACLYASPVEPVLSGPACFVAADACADEWESLVRRCREIFLEKRGCGSRDENIRCRAYDVFHSNPNAARVVQAVAVPQWVVFGTSMAHCVQSAAEGLLRLGRTVTVLQDAVVHGPGGEQATRRSLEWLRTQGACLTSTDEFLCQHG